MGVGQRTFYEWKTRYPQFLQSIKKGKSPVDIEVEHALLKRAKGYTYVETTTEFDVVDTGRVDEDGKPIVEHKIKSVKSVKKEVPPDVGAAAFWLKNRRPDRWREKREEKIAVTSADFSLLDEIAEVMKRDAGQ